MYCSFLTKQTQSCSARISAWWWFTFITYWSTAFQVFFKTPVDGLGFPLLGGVVRSSASWCTSWGRSTGSQFLVINDYRVIHKCSMGTMAIRTLWHKAWISFMELLKYNIRSNIFDKYVRTVCIFYGRGTVFSIATLSKESLAVHILKTRHMYIHHMFQPFLKTEPWR